MSGLIPPYDPATLAVETAAVAALPRLYRVGYVLDRLLAALILGADGQETLSHFIARRHAEGARWAAWGCFLLSLLVEESHCAKTLAQGDTSTSAMWRAGLAMVAGILAVLIGAYALFHLIVAFIRHIL